VLDTGSDEKKSKERKRQRDFIKQNNYLVRYRNEKSDVLEVGYILSKNVFFVGTANIDETTHGFSNKVLDRCSVIEIENDYGKEAGNDRYEGIIEYGTEFDFCIPKKQQVQYECKKMQKNHGDESTEEEFSRLFKDTSEFDKKIEISDKNKHSENKNILKSIFEFVKTEISIELKKEPLFS
jgi:hypothetical protein